MCFFLSHVLLMQSCKNFIHKHKRIVVFTHSSFYDKIIFGFIHRIIYWQHVILIMAGRLSMCLFQTFTKRKKSLLSPVSRYYFNSKLISFKNLPALSHTICRGFICSNLLNKSNDESNILAKLKAAGAASEIKSPSFSDGTDKESSEKKEKDSHFNKKAMKYTFVAFGTIFVGMFGYVIYEWGSPNMDKEGNILQDEFSHRPVIIAYIMRTYKEMMFYNKMIRDPSRDKLLPDPLTEPYYQPPYTLILEMTNILVYPDWSYQTGWRFKKRPGVDYFLQQVGPPLFEVVIFTAEQGFTAYPILDSLDPGGFIMYRLFRDATRYLKGHHVKDLSCLNRDLSKVIYVDWNPKSFALQPENALLVQKWKGNDDDRSLYDLASLLQTIATSNVEDVRTVLEYYSQFDDPVGVYRDNQKKLQEEENKRLQENIGKTTSLAGNLSSYYRGRS